MQASAGYHCSARIYDCVPLTPWPAPPRPTQVEDSRLPGSQFETKKICYYAAVNRVLGAVYIKLTSGTSDLRRLAMDNPALNIKLYKVGSCRLLPCTPASNLYECVYRTKVQLGFACTARTADCSKLPHCLSSSK